MLAGLHLSGQIAADWGFQRNRDFSPANSGLLTYWTERGTNYFHIVVLSVRQS